MRGIRSLTSSLLLLAAACGSAQKAPRLILVSWDGAPDWVVDRLVNEGKLPNVARMAREGSQASQLIAHFPSVTAAGHAAIFTGAWGNVSGITGNSAQILPRSEHSLLETRTGFDSSMLRAEPLYITAALAGKRVCVLSATQAFPAEPHLATLRSARVPDANYFQVSGFESRVAGPAVIRESALREPFPDWDAVPKHDGKPKEFVFSIAGMPFFGLAYDDPQDSAKGLDTVLLRQGTRQKTGAFAEATLKPRAAAKDVKSWSPAFRLDRARHPCNTFFRLFHLAPDGSSMMLYQRSASGLRGAATASQIAAYQGAYPGFHDEVFHDYEDGMLGTTMMDDGAGDAEKRLVELIRLDCEFLKSGTKWAWDTFRPDVLTHYTPSSDGAGHTWMGILDANKPGHDPILAMKIWPYYAEVFRLQDEWLGTILEISGKDTIVALVSDHGMAGAGKFFNVNAVLESAGLLGRTVSDTIDLAKSRALVPPGGGFFVAVNGVDRKGGIVRPEDREDVIRRAADALLAAKDPETGSSVVTRVFRPSELPDLGLVGEPCGDLYIDLAPGYYPTGRLAKEVVSKMPEKYGGGVHGFFPMRRDMHAIFYLWGPGVKKGVLGVNARQVDVAPTLAKTIGIPAPKHSIGKALLEFLAPLAEG